MGDEDGLEWEWEEDDDEDLRRPPDLPRPEGEPLSADDEDRLLSEGRRSPPQRPRKRRGRYRRTTRDDYDPFPLDEEGNVIGVPVNYGPPIETLPEGMAGEPAEDSTAALLSMFGPR